MRIKHVCAFCRQHAVDQCNECDRMFCRAHGRPTGDDADGVAYPGKCDECLGLIEKVESK